jgi:hypothetical protein
LINVYIQEHPDVEVGKWPLEIGGKKKILPFYKIPIKEYLNFNINNGRFSLEKEQKEAELNRKLDSTNEKDEIIIKHLLLEIDTEMKKAELLKEDIRKKGQLEPGVVTHDGFVINGNRRMAVIMELHEEEPTGKWDSLDVIRLPSSISEKDLWKIEAGLQLSMAKVVDYHPVNELLKIKQGRQAGLTVKEISAALYGRSEDWVIESLERLQLINQFNQFFGSHGNYGLIKRFGLHEYFINIQKSIISSKSKYNVTKKDIQKRIEYAFALIRASIINKKNKSKSITHMDIRRLGKIFANLDAEEAFLTNLKDTKDSRKIDAEIIIDDFQNAVEVLKNQADKDKPLILINRALKALENIDIKNKHFKEEKVKLIMIKLSKCVRKLEKILEIELGN